MSDRWLNRRRFVVGLSSISLGAIAGCTSSEESSDEPTTSEESNQEEDTSSESNQESTDTSTSTPEAQWKQNLPRCSSGDYIFRVRGISDMSSTAVASIENVAIDRYDLFRITVTAKEDTLYTDESKTFEVYPELRLEGGESETIALESVDGEIKSVDNLEEIQISARRPDISMSGRDHGCR